MDNNKSSDKQTDMVQIPKSELDMYVKTSDIRTTFFDPIVWAQIKGMAEVFKMSGALPAGDNAAKIIMKIQAGYEIGIAPLLAVRSFYFVKGAMGIENRALAYKLKTMGWKLKYEDGGEGENQYCAVTASNDKGESYTQKFTYKMAKDSGWTESWDDDARAKKTKPGWSAGANRTLMLGYKAISFLCKRYLPEAFGPATDTVENLRDLPEEITPAEEVGEVLDGATSKTTPAEIAPGARPSLKDYLDKKNKKNEAAKQPADAPAAPPADVPAPPDNPYNVPENELSPEEASEIDKMRRRYFATTSKAGIKAEAAKTAIKNHYGVMSFNDLNLTQLKEYVERFEAEEAQEEKK